MPLPIGSVMDTAHSGLAVCFVRIPFLHHKLWLPFSSSGSCAGFVYKSNKLHLFSSGCYLSHWNVHMATMFRWISQIVYYWICHNGLSWLRDVSRWSLELAHTHTQSLIVICPRICNKSITIKRHDYAQKNTKGTFTIGISQSICQLSFENHKYQPKECVTAIVSWALSSGRCLA